MKGLIGQKALHHAYAIEGDKRTILPELYSFIEKYLKIKTHANPDFHFKEFESFGIDSGRELQDQASRKAVVGSMRIFVITISSITSEAQNALLKLFEEPADGTHFFIITPTSEIFLPTLRSRFSIIHMRQSSVTEAENVFVSKFLEVSKSERIKLLENIIEEKNKEKALSFLNNLEAVLHKNKSKSYLWTDEDVKVFEIIHNSRDYLRGRAPSVKMILENIVLNV